MKERKKRVLHATVNAYIQSNEPVGSRSLASAHSFKCSPATLRYELNALEQEGFLTHLHTSSGRVPTTKGYRYYVDAYSPSQSHSQSSLTLIDQSMTDIMQMVVQLVKNTFDYSVIIHQPKIFHDILTMVHFIVSGVNRILVVLACKSGLTEEFSLNFDHNMSQEECDRLTRIVNKEINGQPLPTFDQFCADIMLAIPKYKAILKGLNRQLNRIMTQHSSQQLLLTDGLANMFSLPEFTDVKMVQNVISVMEENTVLARYLNRFLNQTDCTTVIGDEHEVTKLKNCSMVVGSFYKDKTPMGVLGVLGPKRMQYRKVIPLVSELADLMSQFLTFKTTNDQEVFYDENRR